MLYDIWSWTYHQHLTKGHHPNPSQPLPTFRKFPRARPHTPRSRVGRSDSGGCDAQGRARRERVRERTRRVRLGRLLSGRAPCAPPLRRKRTSATPRLRWSTRRSWRSSTSTKSAPRRDAQTSTSKRRNGWTKRCRPSWTVRRRPRPRPPWRPWRRSKRRRRPPQQRRSYALADRHRRPQHLPRRVARDPEFQYARYFYERLQRFGDTPRGRRRPALVKPLLATIQALEELGYEPTIFLPRYALNPRHEDCMRGLRTDSGPSEAREARRARSLPVGGGKSNDDRVLLAWAVAHGADGRVERSLCDRGGRRQRSDAEWLAKNEAHEATVRGNQIVFRDRAAALGVMAKQNNNNCARVARRRFEHRVRGGLPSR